VFVHLHEVRAFCLPDGYEILDSSLDDVKKCLAPTFSKQEIMSLNGNSSLARDVYGVNYLPGFVGLNNLKNTDFVNVVLHALSHVTPVRDYFLQVCMYVLTHRHVFVCMYRSIIEKNRPQYYCIFEDKSLPSYDRVCRRQNHLI
jgi:U4/U6.U5 tri-snRNP-associated protein 2